MCLSWGWREHPTLFQFFHRAEMGFMDLITWRLRIGVHTKDWCAYWCAYSVSSLTERTRWAEVA